MAGPGAAGAAAARRIKGIILRTRPAIRGITSEAPPPLSLALASVSPDEFAFQVLILRSFRCRSDTAQGCGRS
jgi:hypothetical protein